MPFRGLDWLGLAEASGCLAEASRNLVEVSGILTEASGNLAKASGRLAELKEGSGARAKEKEELP